MCVSDTAIPHSVALDTLSPPALPAPPSPDDRALSVQTHHSTAPDLQALHGAHHATAPGQQGYDMNDPALYSSQIKMSFSDDGLKQYSIMLPENSTLASTASNRSPLSKLRSGLSQVSQLIVNQNSSPHTRRRKQVLEAQLLDNTITSKLRFKNCETKILLL